MLLESAAENLAADAAIIAAPLKSDSAPAATFLLTG